MVQFIDLEPGYANKIRTQLAISAGQNIANNLGSYFGNKQKQQQQNDVQQNLSNILFGGQNQNLPPELQLQAYNAMTERQRANAPKASPGGLSGQPVPQEISQSIPGILNANKDANADDLAQALDQAGIPRAYSNSYIENRRRQDEAAPKNAMEERKIKLKESGESKDYYDNLVKSSDTASRVLNSAKVAEQSLRKKDLGPTTLLNLFKNTPLKGLFESPESAVFELATKEFMGSAKEVFGGNRLTNVDVGIIESWLPAIGRNPEANKALVNFISHTQKLNLEKRKIADRLIKENKGYRPLGFEQQVQEEFEKKHGDEANEVYSNFMSQVQPEKAKSTQETAKKFLRVQAPDGTVYKNVPENRVAELLKVGGKVL